ncbi:MAG: hypothetical protein JWR80_6829 [Bradyrhizobium sp.]|nr:hypothetical protein [Bradyrhizobium sp.]
MGTISSRIEEMGTLIQGDGGFALRRDLGGRIRLDLHRVSPGRINRRVRITGILVAEGLIDVAGIADDEEP